MCIILSWDSLVKDGLNKLIEVEGYYPYQKEHETDSNYLDRLLTGHPIRVFLDDDS